jgi:hypothetical protein
VTVTVVGSESSGLATLLAELIEQNLARDPFRRRLLRPCVAALEASDADVTVHVRIDAGAARIGDGDVPDAHLRVRADGERLLALTSARLRLGLPDPIHRDGRAVLRDLLLRRIRVRGLVRHPIRLARFTSLLSVADGGR